MIAPRAVSCPYAIMAAPPPRAQDHEVSGARAT
jgi:hypothetical protein